MKPASYSVYPYEYKYQNKTIFVVFGIRYSYTNNANKDTVSRIPNIFALA